MDTQVPYERTKAEIEILLKSYGVKGIRWTIIEGQEDFAEILDVAIKDFPVLPTIKACYGSDPKELMFQAQGFGAKSIIRVQKWAAIWFGIVPPLFLSSLYLLRSIFGRAREWFFPVYSSLPVATRITFPPT